MRKKKSLYEDNVFNVKGTSVNKGNVPNSLAVDIRKKLLVIMEETNQRINDEYFNYNGKQRPKMEQYKYGNILSTLSARDSNLLQLYYFSDTGTLEFLTEENYKEKYCYGEVMLHKNRVKDFFIWYIYDKDYRLIDMENQIKEIVQYNLKKYIYWKSKRKKVDYSKLNLPI